MSNELNEPPSDLFEDVFWNAIGDVVDHAPYHLLKYAVDTAHYTCGGEEGDQNYDYGKMLLKEAGINVGVE